MAKKVPVPKFKAAAPVRVRKLGEPAQAYEVELERDEEGWWVATVPSLPGCQTQGRSIGQVRDRIREAIAAFTDAPAEVDVMLMPPGKLRARLRSVTALRRQADEAARKSQEAVREVARELVDSGMSRRDVGELLGLSFQRIHQLVES